jgi:hypothetical protein
MKCLRSVMSMTTLALCIAATMNVVSAQQVIGKFTFKGGDGLTSATAIIVGGAEGKPVHFPDGHSITAFAPDMIDAIDLWVKQNKPGWRVQALAQSGDTFFLVRIEKTSETPILLYFTREH